VIYNMIQETRIIITNKQVCVMTLGDGFVVWHPRLYSLYTLKFPLLQSTIKTNEYFLDFEVRFIIQINETLTRFSLPKRRMDNNERQIYT
jgi:hypothetical protein